MEWKTWHLFLSHPSMFTGQVMSFRPARRICSKDMHLRHLRNGLCRSSGLELKWLTICLVRRSQITEQVHLRSGASTERGCSLHWRWRLSDAFSICAWPQFFEPATNIGLPLEHICCMSELANQSNYKHHCMTRMLELIPFQSSDSQSACNAWLQQ